MNTLSDFSVSICFYAEQHLAESSELSIAYWFTNSYWLQWFDTAQNTVKLTAGNQHFFWLVSVETLTEKY